MNEDCNEFLNSADEFVRKIEAEGDDIFVNYVAEVDSIELLNKLLNHLQEQKIRLERKHQAQMNLIVSRINELYVEKHL
jgi:hypothetical protein